VSLLPGMLAGIEVNALSAEGKLALLSHSTDATEAFGRLLAGCLQKDDVLTLDGDLGAGKTALTRGIAAGLNCRVPVSSPTFTLLIEHPATATGLALYHFDVYRLSDSNDFCEIGLDEYFNQGGVCVIEWGHLISDILPDRTLEIRLWQVDPDQPDLRRIEISWPANPGRLNDVINRLVKSER